MITGSTSIAEGAINDIGYFRESHILDLLPLAVYVCDVEGRIVNYNRKAADLWGTTPEKADSAELLYLGFKLYHSGGAHMPYSATPFATALRDGQTCKDVEIILKRPDLARHVLKVNVIPLRNDKHQLTGTINCISDGPILNKQQYHYDELLNGLPAGLYTCDKEGNITFFNEQAVELWGYRPDIMDSSLKFCACYKVWLEDGTFLPASETPMAVALRTGQVFRNVDAQVERQDGSKFFARLSINPFFDEKKQVVGAINIFQDVTALKEAERALKISEEKYKALCEMLETNVKKKTEDLMSTNDELKKSRESYHQMVEEIEDYAIIRLDRNGFIQNWNKGAEKIKGYKEEEIVGKHFQLFYMQEERDSGVPQKLIDDAVLNGKTSVEGWRLRKDGSRFWGSTVIAALHDENNNIAGFTKVTRDLTEKKEVEDKLREYSNSLEFQNRELEQFAYAASHDMKEPLRKILLYNNYIKDHGSEQMDERLKDYLNRSIRAADRMNDLIEDLLTYSRTAIGEQDFEEVNMKALISEIVSDHKEELDQKHIRVEISKLPTIQAVHFQMKQLFYNLINNAIKYMSRDRPGLIKIEGGIYRPSAIKGHSMMSEVEYYHISVQDNGVGFEQEYAEKIFEVFQRLGNVADAKGSGIGLAICNKIVQNHKGIIRATGKVDQGARFDVYFPKGFR
ncbi:MAG TPA: PAS domain S-box protein [Flavipsychrobacter sp.]|nr:PAS domain S-box protein [Flavipsychrobacter sp.]